MDNEKEFTPQESLKLIHSMIETTKHSISDKSHYFLLWGWTVMIGYIVQFYLKVIIGNANYYLAWLIVPVALLFHIFFIIRDKKRVHVKTFISDANRYLWTAVGFAFIVLIFIFSKIGWQYCYPFYILLYGIGTYISGCFIKFKPLIIGGLFCFPLSVASSYLNPDTQIIFGALAVFISYVIPGHLLRIQYRKQH